MSNFQIGYSLMLNFDTMLGFEPLIARTMPWLIAVQTSPMLANVPRVIWIFDLFLQSLSVMMYMIYKLLLCLWWCTWYINCFSLFQVQWIPRQRCVCPSLVLQNLYLRQNALRSHPCCTVAELYNGRDATQVSRGDTYYLFVQMFPLDYPL